MIRRYGFRSRPFMRTFDQYDYVDCHNYMDIHDSKALSMAIQKLQTMLVGRLVQTN